MGIYANSQLLADSFAAKGYTTLIPDIFNGDAIPLNKFPTTDLSSWISEGFDGKNPHSTEYVDPIIIAAIKTLRELGIDRIGGVGYCFGAKVKPIPIYESNLPIQFYVNFLSMSYDISKVVLKPDLLHTPVLWKKMS